MDILPFENGLHKGVAIRRGEVAIDLAALGNDFPTTLDGIIAGGPELLAAIASATAASSSGWQPASTFAPAYPVSGQHKIICVGLNYVAHAKEGGHAIPEYPAFFLRVRDSMLASQEAIQRPWVSEKLDYEAELMVVVGKTARNVREAEALEYVFGYTAFNDASVRDYQRKGGQWTPGKNFDRTGAVGPVIVTADALPPGANGLDIMCRLNGETVQRSNTSDMIFSVPRIISLCSQFTTLNPGDLIAMGTPSGVGFARNPPVFMKAGDRVEVEIEKIGILTNDVIER